MPTFSGSTRMKIKANSFSVTSPLTGSGTQAEPFKLIDADENGKTLVWQNGAWIIGEVQGGSGGEGNEGSGTPVGEAGGDLTGSYPNPTVSKLQGKDVAAEEPATGQLLQWTGNSWAPRTIAQTQVSVAFAGVAAEGASTLVSSFYVSEAMTLLSGSDGSLALIGGATTNSNTTLSLVPLNSNVPAVSWSRTGLLGSASLGSGSTLTKGWYDIVLSGSSNLTAFARGIYLVSSGGE